jgi:hypothetical protein
MHLRSQANLEHLAEMVKDMPFFKDRGLTGPSLIEVVNCFTIENVEPNKTIMEYGDIGEHFYFILKGRVQMKIPDPSRLKLFELCVKRIEELNEQISISNQITERLTHQLGE